MACWGQALVQWLGLTLGLPPPLGSPLASAGPLWPSLAPPPLHRLLSVIEGTSVKRCHSESGAACETPRGKTGILQRRAWKRVPRSCQSPREVELSSQRPVSHTIWLSPASTSPRRGACVQAHVSACAFNPLDLFHSLALLTLLTCFEMTPASTEVSPSPVLETSRLNDPCRGAAAECHLLPSRSAGSVRVVLVGSMDSLYLSLPLIPSLPMAEVMRPPTAGHLLHSLSRPESGATAHGPGSSRASSLGAGPALPSQH